MLNSLFLLAIGFGVGMFGTMIGAGGGFILVPVLLLLYPKDSPETTTAISLTVTFANSFSGSVAYARMKRISYRYGLIFAGASIPGAVLGALTTQYIKRGTFDLIFAIVMIMAAAYIFLRAPRESHLDPGEPIRLSPGNVAIGIAISLVVGYCSILLGIGGGIIHVPALVSILGFPVHAATATSHFILALMTGTGTLVHIVSDGYREGAGRAITIAIGALAGAQLGALMSTHVKGRSIIRALAVGLALVGVRLLILVFSVYRR